MKTFRMFFAAIVAVSFLLSVSWAAGKNSDGSVRVDGYKKKDGTTVAPHNRTAPNKTKNDNWSTKGNVNPYTGKPGTKPRDGETTTKVKRSIVTAGSEGSQAPTRSKAELQETVRRCNGLLESYVRAPYGQSPFNAEKYEEIRKERDLALGELKAGN